jgi:hypothetical protein
MYEPTCFTVNSLDIWSSLIYEYTERIKHNGTTQFAFRIGSFLCIIWGSHGGSYKEYYLLGAGHAVA